MALRAVPDHPKFAQFKALIGQPKGVALGWLEAIWHFCGKFTPQGNIGKYTDSAIEAWVEWNGEPGKLIASMVESGWLDRSTTYRLIVHDWHNHADATTRKQVGRLKLQFVTMSKTCPGQVQDNAGTLETKTEFVLDPQGQGQGQVSGPEPGAVAAKQPSPTKAAPPAPDAEGFLEGLSELQYATGILERCAIVDTFRLKDATAKTIVILAKEGACRKHIAAEVLEKRIVAAQARGDTINAFWFEDSKWKETEGNNGTNRPSASKQRVDNNRRAITEALAKRGVAGPWDTAQSNSQEVPKPGCEGFDGRVPERSGTAGPEVLPPERGSRDRSPPD